MRVRLKHAVLAELISKGHLSQNHWAIRLELSSGHLADLVNGRHPYPSAVTREKLVRGLDTEFDTLFEIETPDAAHRDTDLRSRLEAVLSDRYVIDDVLGEGGMGKVYQARDVKHGRPVALKVVLPDAVASLGNNQFLSEIRRTAVMQHPNILPLLDSGVGAECPYLVTPLVREGSLRQLMDERGRLSPLETLNWLRGVCHALDYAHRQNLVHCDVKPENVLISSNQSVVTDFGVSRAIHLDGRPRGKTIDTSSGTPAYMSPEQASGEPVDGKSDQYSVACMAFEMMAGHPPFSGTNDMAVVAKRFLDEPPDIRAVAPTVPYAVGAVLRKAMSLDGRRRYATISAFLDAFNAAARTSERSILELTEDAVLGFVHHGREFITSRLLPARLKYTPKYPNRTVFGRNAMTTLVQDLKFASRLLTRQRLFTIVAVLTLGLGIGANTAIFSVINGFLLTPLPYPDPEQLVTLWEVSESGSTSHVAGANFVDWKQEGTNFDGMAVHPSFAFGGPSTVLGGNQPVRVLVSSVSDDFFDVFRIEPTGGRLFSAADFAADAIGTVVVSHRFWQTQLSADPNLPAHTLQLSGSTFQVVGVAPPGFRYPEDTDVWLPTTVGQNPSRTSHNWAVIARLRDGVTIEEAQTQMSALGARLKSAFGENIDAVDIRVTELQEEIVGSLRQPLNILLGASVMVLLVACTNIASTLLAQGTVRQREFAIRRAMGANRSRMVRQLIVENLTLAVFGTATGLALSFGIVRALSAVAPSGLAIGEKASIDGVVVSVTIIVAIGATLLFGLYPALKATQENVGTSLRSGDRGNAVSRSGHSWQAIIGGEVALALMLLVGAGLLIRSFWGIMSVNPGFNPGGIVTANISVPSNKYADDEALVAYFERVEESLSSIPGVEHVGVINHVPLGGSRINGGFEIEGWEAAESPYADYRVVTGGYFDAMGIPVVRGRTFDNRDRAGTTHSAVVNQRLAQTYWPGENPVGRRIRNLANDSWVYPDEWITIVGVVGDVRHRGLTQDPDREIYVNVAQRPFRARGAVITLRTSRLTPDFGSSVRDAMRQVDPDIPVELSSMDDYLSASISDRRFIMLVLGTFASCALTLAMVGIYGVVSYSVAQRTREMGVRLALGAEPRHVRHLVQRGAMLTVGTGVLVGLAGAFALSRVIQTMLFDVSPTDPIIFSAVATVLLGSAWIASLIPALRSTRVDPMITMRQD